MAATFPSNPVVPFGSPAARTYTELRVQTQILCAIHEMLNRLVGPTNITVAGINDTTQADISLDAEAMRNDPAFQGQ